MVKRWLANVSEKPCLLKRRGVVHEPPDRCNQGLPKLVKLLRRHSVGSPALQHVGAKYTHFLEDCHRTLCEKICESLLGAPRAVEV